jgi:hypothetical protein
VALWLLDPLIMSRSLVVAIVVGAFAAPAAACPPGPCSKYRHLEAPPPVVITTYRRAIRDTPPAFDRKKVIAFLTGASWDPVIPPQPASASMFPPPFAPWIRFVEAARMTKAMLGDVGARTVLIREISSDDGVTFVGVDGQMFALERCKDVANDWSSCLVRRDPKVHTPHFARPPNPPN